uniref:Xylose isomerase-like TIM barrel domain-containing protein n=1 Tax=Xiphophorus couchianus TaxID=32473 RepID=A0A3B5M1P9_9TELE
MIMSGSLSFFGEPISILKMTGAMPGVRQISSSRSCCMVASVQSECWGRGLQEGITGLIEPINTRITDPRYFLDSPHQAAAILGKVGKPNIQLQMDIFHWQIMDGNLTKNMHKYFPIIGHVQIAQVPARNEPDSNGELCYRYLLNTLEKLGYQGYIGCEYKPLGKSFIRSEWHFITYTHTRLRPHTYLLYIYMYIK